MTDSSALVSPSPIEPLNAGGIHTQANNFLQAVQTGVDARTGQFNLTINVPLGVANNLCGPSLSLTWMFSTLSSHQNRGFGFGWSLLLSQLTLAGDSSSLSLTSGEQFAVDLDKSDTSIGGRMAFHDYKLDAIRLIRHDEDSFRVEQKSGETEFLRQVEKRGAYLLHELRSPEGRRLYLEWRVLNDIPRLIQVRDEQRTLASIDRNDGSPVLKLEPDSTHQSEVKFNLFNDQLRNVELPSLSSPFFVEYETRAVGKGQQLRLPKIVKSPLGATDEVIWSSDSTSHLLPKDAPLDFVPRVSRWIRTDGAAQTTLVRTYEWQGNRNHFGYGSDRPFRWQTGRDNLYQLLEPYTYSVVETQIDEHSETLATITRVWDRHHLLTAENSVSGTCETKVETIYDFNYEISWPEQTPWCQLPHRIKTTYVDRNTNKNRAEEVTHTYDRFGNMLSTVLPTGVQEIYEYYPAAGEPGKCPPVTSGIARHLKKKTVIPAPVHVFNQAVADLPGSPAPTLFTCHTYVDLPSLIADSAAHALISTEELWDGDTLLEATVQEYDRDATSPHYGRQTKASTTLGGKTTVTQFGYEILEARLYSSVTINGFEGDAINRSTTRDARSLTTGLTVLDQTAAGVKTEYEHDPLGRIKRVVIASGTGFSAERTCEYHVDDNFTRHNAPTSLSFQPGVAVEEADVTGQRKRSWFDSSGRLVLEQMEDIDHPPDDPQAPSAFLDMAANSYDALGRAVEQTTWDWAWVADKLQLISTLTTHIEYDDWGHVNKQTDANGVITHSVHDPVAMRSEQWLQSASGALSGKQITYSNVAGSPVREESYDNNDRLVRTTYYTRDGLDRVVETCIQPSTGLQSVKRVEYDAYSRTVRQTLPDGTAVVWTYLAHSDADHPESVSVEPPKIRAEGSHA